MKPLGLTSQEKAYLVAFLKTVTSDLQSDRRNRKESLT